MNNALIRFLSNVFFKFGSSIFDSDSLVEAATTKIIIPVIYDCLGPLFSKGGCRYLTCATISVRAAHTKTGFVKASNEFSEFWFGRTVTKYLHPVLTGSATSCSHFHRTANTPLVEFVLFFVLVPVRSHLLALRTIQIDLKTGVMRCRNFEKCCVALC